MKRIYLVLTFDHELPLGGIRNASYADSLFNPTDKILEIADSYNIPVTLFSDVLSGLKFKDWKVNDYSEPYVKQLQNAILRGHDVQLHLHPHWISSSHNDKTYIPSNKFSLSDYKNGYYPNNISGIIEQGVNFLNNICKPLNEKYRCIAFRAGGYNISPCTAEIFSALWEHGIRIDSSISKGYRFQSHINCVDFNNTPKQANWFIPLQGPINSSCSNGIFEVPIISMPRTPINNIPFLIKRVIYRYRQSPMTGIGLHEINSGFFQKMKRLLPFSAWMLSFDGYYDSSPKLMQILSAYIRKHENDKVIFASTIAHPKSMNDYNFNLMRDFIRDVINKYGDQLVFCNYEDIYNLIKSDK